MNDLSCLGLTTTIIMERSPCTKLRYARDVVKSWWARRTGWRQTLYHQSTGSPKNTNRFLTRVSLSPDILFKASQSQARHDAHMRHTVNETCRTPPISVEKASRLVRGLDVTITAHLTNGGMSRIFATPSPDILVKISNMTSGWSQFEPHGYRLLEAKGLPAAKILHALFREGHMVLVVERLHCTVASVIKTTALQGGFHIDTITNALAHLLHHLRRANLTFGDLSPDNIMVRHSTQDLVLIDPQFTLPTDVLARTMGKHAAASFDTIHLALKIMAMGSVSKHPSVRDATRAITCALLHTDHPPSVLHMTTWLLHDVPVGLRLAYASLQRFSAPPRDKEEDGDQIETPAP